VHAEIRSIETITFDSSRFQYSAQRRAVREKDVVSTSNFNKTEDIRKYVYFLIKNALQNTAFCHPVLATNLLKGLYCSLSITKKQ